MSEQIIGRIVRQLGPQGRYAERLERAFSRMANDELQALNELVTGFRRLGRNEILLASESIAGLAELYSTNDLATRGLAVATEVLLRYFVDADPAAGEMDHYRLVQDRLIGPLMNYPQPYRILVALQREQELVAELTRWRPAEWERQPGTSVQREFLLRTIAPLLRYVRDPANVPDILARWTFKSLEIATVVNLQGVEALEDPVSLIDATPRQFREANHAVHKRFAGLLHISLSEHPI